MSFVCLFVEKALHKLAQYQVVFFFHPFCGSLLGLPLGRDWGSGFLNPAGMRCSIVGKVGVALRPALCLRRRHRGVGFFFPLESDPKDNWVEV